MTVTAGSGRRPRCRAAAAAVVALGVVPAAAQDAVRADELTPATVIVDRRQLASLDRSLRSLQVLCVDRSEDLQPLAEFRELVHLVIGPPPGKWMQPAVWSLAPLAQCTTLRTLEIGFLQGLEPKDLRVLRSLPRLAELTLRGPAHVLDAALLDELAALPLRVLRLRKGVTLRPATFGRLAELPLLEALELRECAGLDACDLTLLARARRLRRLEIAGLRGRPAHPGMTPQHPAWRESGATGVLVADVRAFARLPELRELILQGSHLGDGVLQALPPQLTALDLSDATGLTADGLAAVARLPALVAFACSVQPGGGNVLEDPLANRPGGVAIDDALRHIVRTRPLRELTLHGLLPQAFVDDLARHPTLRVLRLPGPNDRHHTVNVPVLDLAFAATMPALEQLALQNWWPQGGTPLAACAKLRRVVLTGHAARHAEEFRRVLGRERVVEPFLFPPLLPDQQPGR